MLNLTLLSADELSLLKGGEPAPTPAVIERPKVLPPKIEKPDFGPDFGGPIVPDYPPHQGGIDGFILPAP